MAQVLTAPTESEALFVETLTTGQPPKLAWWDINLLQSPNGDHPEISSTVSGQGVDEDNSWESEGWRYIETITEEGQVKRERVQLTAYELLHPKEGYVIVNATPHGRNTTYIDTTMSIQLTHDSKAFVFNDVRTDFNLLGVEPVSPDISVVFDVSQEKDWSTFDCREEGAYPSVIFEVTSPSTRENDFGEKHEYYCRAEVPYYVILDIIYDRNKQATGYNLFVYELSGSQYVEMQPDHLGRYWLPPLGISVGIGEKGILCYDALGNLVMGSDELAHALNETKHERNAAQELAEQEAARADEQERIAQQEATRAVEQERIAEQERMLAQQEATRAVEQERIAQQEATRAAEQERIAQQETARAIEQERIADEALQAQLAAEAKIAELLARMAELEDKS